MFCDRVQAKSASFTLTEGNIATVITICQKLDGLPFAIELAAVHVPTLGLNELAKRLFRVLKNSSSFLLPHRATLTKTLDWSYELLTVQEQALLCRLSVFNGGWTLEAAEAVCAVTDTDKEITYDLMLHLVNKSLVVVEGQAERPRYRLLEVVREYMSHKRNEREEERQFHERHFAFFLQFAHQANSRLNAFDQAYWLDRLDEEHDNLRTALDAASPCEQRAHLASLLWRFWAARGYLIEGQTKLESALSQCKEFSDDSCARALNGLGVILSRQGDYTSAKSTLLKCLKLRRKLKDRRGMAETYNNLGNIARDQNALEIAEDYFEKSLAICRRAKDAWGEAVSLTNFGSLDISRSNFAHARSYYEQSLKVYREFGDIANIATVTNNLGVIANALDDFDSARSYYEESLAKLEELRNSWAVAITLSNLAQVDYELKEYGLSELRFKHSIALRRQLGDRAGMAYPLLGLGEVYAATENYPRATLALAAAAAVRLEHGIPASVETQALIDSTMLKVKNALGVEAFERLWSRTNQDSIESALDALSVSHPVQLSAEQLT